MKTSYGFKNWFFYVDVDKQEYCHRDQYIALTTAIVDSLKEKKKHAVKFL